MSVRNMMKVMMSLLMALLLAISLAATTAEATRLDQSFTSTADDERVPYYVCAMFCPGSCTCDRAARPKSRCTCDLAGYSINFKKPAALLHTSAGTLQEKSDLIPWTECHETCDSCSCTKIWPPEANWCSCLDDTAPNKAAAVAVHKVPKVTAVLFPREECDKNCNYVCACALIWPPPKYCSCAEPIHPKAKCSENCEGVCVCDSPEKCSCSTDIKLSEKPAVVAVHQVSRVNAVLFPREECDKNCNSHCACTLIWPPPKYCSCFHPIHPKAKCSENCEGVCVCDSPENCSCRTVIKLSKVNAPKKEKSDLIPWKECHETCDHCTCTKIWPPEANWCFPCSDDSLTKKEVAAVAVQQVSKVKAALFPKGGMIPYTECMETCEICACTLIWPPEANWCFPCFTKKNEIAAVQQLPKLRAVLFPREECEKKCNVHCACTAIEPPPKYCSCSDPKATLLSV